MTSDALALGGLALLDSTVCAVPPGDPRPRPSENQVTFSRNKEMMQPCLLCLHLISLVARRGHLQQKHFAATEEMVDPV